MPDPIQDNRDIQVKTQLGDNVLLFSEMQGTEKLSTLFEYNLGLISTDFEVDLNKLLGTDITVKVQTGRKETRYFNGYVSRCAHGSSGGDYAHYDFTLKPWFWFLTRTADCRIFQEMSVPDIIKKIFEEEGFSDFDNRLTGQYEKWEYCVQYRETDYNFLSRLMEQEGIYYYFVHSDGAHKLVLCDSFSAHQSASGFETVDYFPAGQSRSEDHLNVWGLSRQLQPGKFAIKDFNYEDPKSDLKVAEQYSSKHARADYEIFDYPGEYVKRKAGEDLVKFRMEEAQSQCEIMEGSGDVQGLAAGNLFKLGNSERADQNQEYLIIESSHSLSIDSYSSGGGGEVMMQCSVRCIPSGQQFRAPRITPKPSVSGPQTAIVVGPGGEEIWTDKLGRVKLQFHWDRYGKSDENSSCWVRVSQAWAGAGWGAMYIPRIGQEVIVECLEGDPDRPIVTGRVYNGDNDVPYDLPANKTQSGIKSRSSQKGSSSNFNEIRMEDKKGEEELFIHGEKDQKNIVKNNDFTRIGNDRTREVGNDEFITIAKNREEDVGEDETITIGKNQSIDIGDDQKIKVGKKFELIAGDQITLKTGSASIVMKKDGTIEIKGKDVKVTASANVKIKANAKVAINGTGGVDVKASGPVAVKGSAVKLN